MTERLVDVKTGGERVLHTFPISIGDQAAEPGEDSFKKKALEAAAHANLVPNKDLPTLGADLHLSRSGPLEPDPDRLGVMAETREGLEQVVREGAFLLWERAGRPEGRAEEFWHRAQHARWSERAYALWEREGCPEGQAVAHWYRTIDFERS